MVNGISGGGGLDRSQLDAVLKKLQQRSADMAGGEAPATAGGGFADAVVKNLAEVESTVRRSDSLTTDALKGDLDFHEVAAKVKEAELTFNFSMQVRNKLIDAYREIMRMSV